MLILRQVFRGYIMQMQNLQKLTKIKKKKTAAATHLYVSCSWHKSSSQHEITVMLNHFVTAAPLIS